MANRYSNRSQRDQERGQNFGGSRRNQNLNEYGGSRTYGGGRNFGRPRPRTYRHGLRPGPSADGSGVDLD